MQYYLTIKYIHIFLVVLSVAMFNLRFWLRWAFPMRPLRALWRRSRDITDTLLMAAGIALAVLTYAVPFVTARWLGIKLCLLLCYILFGIFATRVYPRSREAFFNYFMCLVCVALMAVMAVYKPYF